LGFCISLSEPKIPDPDRYDEAGPEFNRSTLLGEWDEVFEALLRERIARDGLDPVDDFLPQLRAHMNRGAEIACGRIKSLSDVCGLVPDRA
jgi:DNA sulfur modification protein DndE